ncbi:hypothetical protein M902_0652 [Bacteriovorax sp. BAL6_X]|uniref:hypothetical protein n=1 Tax=Bacteriovorax sp. BAL6_X TaxID=1201290 RepID=UPI000386E6B1|nr:hypothetical protein [Bacteriovorax sp. BAL6_X]EPZ50122.1 hypothetical protein M902_0652 [Bacteriovorax sp. BAL6_X]
MKLFSMLISLLLITNVNASELNGLNIIETTETALTEASIEVGADSIIAWNAELEGHEVVVSVLNEHDINITYGCHYHGPVAACHEESYTQGDDHKHKDAQITLDYIKAANQSALSKFEKTLSRKGNDLSKVEAVKVWLSIEDDHDHDHGHHHLAKADDHDHGADVWTKINYNITGKTQTIYVLCHTHGHEADFSCHYRLSGENEPSL